MTVYRDETGLEFELPKLTLKLAEEMDAVPNQGGIQATAKAMYAFVSKVLPKDYLRGALDGSKVEDIDIVSLRNIYDGVNNAYTTALDDGKIQSMTEKLESVMPMIETMDKVMNLDNQAKSRQGFKRIK